jgi:hypothetical protein
MNEEILLFLICVTFIESLNLLDFSFLIYKIRLAEHWIFVGIS